jgi:pimeloyl-ACP methyl ester carboxylesterase
MLAVTSPELVQSLTLIEASGPLSEEAEYLPARMARSLQDRLQPTRFQSRVFASKNDAVAARLKAARMHSSSARLIIDRQVEAVAEGYRWRFDPRWRMASPQYQTEAQVRAVLSTVACRTLTVIATDGFLANRAQTQERLDCLPLHQSITLPGQHHLHMDTPEPVAAAINQFLQAAPALGG